MREIRFRAWDNSTPQMIYDTFPSGLSSSDILARWEPKWIMQFTGLKDKNGKEIYEGDMVKYQIANTDEKYDDGTVYFSAPAACFKVDYFSFEKIYHSNLEVIGNIYENPELLK